LGADAVTPGPGRRGDDAPQQLAADAAEYREIAGKLRAASTHALTVVDRVVRAATPATWDGRWAGECGATIAAWRSAAEASAAELARRAAALETHARDLDDRAAAASHTG
jgi:hypothetical protein